MLFGGFGSAVDGLGSVARDHPGTPKAHRSLNTTVVIVSQRASSVKDADKIIVLDDGKAVDIGTHEELLKTSDVYREIYRSQYELDGEVSA